MTKSKIFLYFCLAFAGGIASGSFILTPRLFLLGLLITGVFLASVFWRYKKIAVAGFCFLFLVLGIWRYQSAEAQNSKSKIQNNQVTLVGVVYREPDAREKNTQLKIKNEKFKILVTTGRYPEYQYGDKLRIAGKLAEPPVFNEFNYRDYLKKDGITAIMSFPKIELVGSGFGNPVMEILIAFKNKFEETAASLIAMPQEGFLEALVFGQESNISQDWKNKLNITGTRHIAAVSGMNITIIASLIASFAPFYATISLLFLYILMIGAPASAVRAFIMAIIFILAKKLGRPASGSRAVFFAATFMLAINSLLLKSDVGFQLSFLAIMGIVYLQPFLSRRLRAVPDPKIFPVRTTLSATLAAQTFTMPVLIFNFGYISPFSPITNVLIVPVLAPLTILIFIFSLSAIVFQPLGFLLSFPVWLGLTYITKIVEWFSYLSSVL